MRWPVRVVEVTGSTNADLVAEASRGAAGPQLLASRAQTAGRGRLERDWASPPGSSMAVSLLWRPAVPQARWTWVPMVVGLGVLDGLARLGVRAALKWPNDVVVGAPDGSPDGALTGLRKLAGILVEVAPGDCGPCLVAGVGVNLGQAGSGLPVPGATSVRLLTGTAPRFEDALDAVAEGLQGRLERWEDAGADVDASGLAADYRAACTTIGRHVVVRRRAADEVVTGRVEGVAADGSLLLDSDSGLLQVFVGDVEHVR